MTIRQAALGPRTFGCVLLAASMLFAASATWSATCSLDYELPADLPPDVTVPDQATDADFMTFSWQHFLALNAPAVEGRISVDGDNPTQWSGWSSSADLYDSASPGPSGTRFYPAACQAIPDHTNYRVLQQVGKVDDAFLEAATAGLSNDPVIDADGKFLRYEILYSPAMYQEIITQGLNEQSQLFNLTADVNLSCGVDTYTGGDPAAADMGAMMLKVAWRDASELSADRLALFHTEDLLVFTPGYRNSTGRNTCELKTMAMVGMHIGHKTTKQPVWIWATFEHQLNAPDCESQSPAPSQPGEATTNKTCPADTGGVAYSFFPADCSDGACAECNTAPTANGAPDQCVNPVAVDSGSWCVDLGPSPTSGKSKLCRQVPASVCVDDVATACTSDADCGGASGSCVPSYPAVAEQNTACLNAIANAGNGDSVWLNYELIGAQWVAETFTDCQNAVAAVITPPPDTQNGPGPVKRQNLRELVTLTDADVNPAVERPLLGNSSMESYDRANCLGCHAKSYMGSFCENDPSLQCNEATDCSSVGGDCTKYSFNTDFVYSLKLEAAQQPGLLLSGRSLLYREGLWLNWLTPKLFLTMRSPDTLLGLADSKDDPRCNASPDGTVKARLGFVRNGQAFTQPELIDLPCQGWRLQGDAANPRGYEYRDPLGLSGPCRRVDIDQRRGVTAWCYGPGVPSDLANVGETLNVVLETGSLRFCADYGDFRQRGRHGLLRSRNNAAPSLCALW